MNSDAEVKAALQRLLQAPEFIDSARLVSFLQYVVEKKLAGEQDQIKAKTIGMDVYGYSVDEIEERGSVVRVDAGRIRRKLEDYYAGSGKNERLRIALPKGGYVPEFEVVDRSPPAETAQTDAGWGRKLLLPALLMLCIVVAAGAFLFARHTQLGGTSAGQTAEREDIFDVSPQRVEAANLAANGRDLIFPATDPRRLTAALELFRSAIEADPNYYGGHAGAAQVYAFQAFLSLDDTVRSTFAESALESSSRAVALAPEAAWVISAQAFSRLAAGQPESAMRLSAKATNMAPSDVHIGEFDALISLFTMDFDRVIARYEGFLNDGATEAGFVFDNALGSAYYHLGDDQNAVNAWKRGISKGGPFGPVIVAYLMAAHYRLGNVEEARELAELSMKTWPEARVDLWFRKAFVSEEPGLELEAGMRGAGWAPAE